MLISIPFVENETSGRLISIVEKSLLIDENLSVSVVAVELAPFTKRWLLRRLMLLLSVILVSNSNAVSMSNEDGRLTYVVAENIVHSSCPLSIFVVLVLCIIFDCVRRGWQNIVAMIWCLLALIFYEHKSRHTHHCHCHPPNHSFILVGYPVFTFPRLKDTCCTKIRYINVVIRVRNKYSN